MARFIKRLSRSKLLEGRVTEVLCPELLGLPPANWIDCLCLNADQLMSEIKSYLSEDDMQHERIHLVIKLLEYGTSKALILCRCA